MTELYTLSLFLRSGQKVDLFFESKAKARDRFLMYVSEHATVIGDDYGTDVVTFDSQEPTVAAIMLQDCGRASEVSVEVALLQARNNVRANERARHDPMITKAQMQAPIVMPPGFNGRG